MMKRKLPNEISRFLADHPDYEAAFRPDADLMQQLQTGGVHPFIIHKCARETWAVFVETDEINEFLAAHPSAIAATFDGTTFEPAQEH
jgi:hypothetical protein